MVYGGVIFALVSVLAYSIWAFHLIPGTAAMYAATAAAYIGLGGFALSRLLRAPAARKRFPFLFAAGFVLYAVCWCAFWFGLKGKYQADLWGAAVGLAAMTALLRRALGISAPFLPLYAVLFTFYTFGYALGGELHKMFPGATGRLLWGAGHGLGFGLGLGYLLSQVRDARPASVTLPTSETSSASSHS